MLQLLLFPKVVLWLYRRVAFLPVVPTSIRRCTWRVSVHYSTPHHTWPGRWWCGKIHTCISCVRHNPWDDPRIPLRGMPTTRSCLPYHPPRPQRGPTTGGIRPRTVFRASWTLSRAWWRWEPIRVSCLCWHINRLVRYRRPVPTAISDPTTHVRRYCDP